MPYQHGSTRPRLQRISHDAAPEVLAVTSRLLDIQREAKSWEAIGAWAPGGQNVGTESEPLRVTSAAITRSLIDVLGVQPERGRNFTEEEDRNGGPRVAIISHGLWQRALAEQVTSLANRFRSTRQQPPLLV